MRLKKLRVSGNFLAQIWTTGYRDHGAEVTDGLPPGAILRGVQYEPTGIAYFFFEHPDFEELPEAAVVPETEVWMQARFDEHVEVDAILDDGFASPEVKMERLRAWQDARRARAVAVP
jgi:hypothetical protein